MDETLWRYIVSYPDLLLWYSRSGDTDGIRSHMVGGHEGRIVPPTLEHSDWSDSYYARVATDPQYIELARLGIAPTCIYNAFACYGDNYENYGRVSKAVGLLKATQLPLGVLAQLVEMDASLPEGTALLRGMSEDKILFRGLPVPVTAPFMNYMERTKCLDPRVNVAILVSWLETGGAELEAYWLYKGAEALGLTPILMILDKSAVTPFFAGASLRILDVPGIVEMEVGVAYKDIPIESKTYLLNVLLEWGNFDIIHLIHSWVGYKLFSSANWSRRSHGNRRLLVSAFCPHVHRDGRLDGYFRFFPEMDSTVAAYVFDSGWYADEIAKLYDIEEERRPVLRFPVVPRMAKLTGVPTERGDRILWASRLDFQKNPYIVFDIARAMPDVSFDMYGGEVLNDLRMEWNKAPENVKYQGKFFAFEELPVEMYRAFLYTSTFDGMPNILLEAALAGLPIVSSSVGGIPEFLSGGGGALVPDHGDVNGYVRHIRAMLEDHDLANRVADEAHRRVTEDRSFDSFVNQLSKITLYGRGSAGRAASM
jgi:glycosyltransferase involved in cell wall biosynthesis